jgi:hypothetical protein
MAVRGIRIPWQLIDLGGSRVGGRLLVRGLSVELSWSCFPWHTGTTAGETAFP